MAQGNFKEATKRLPRTFQEVYDQPKVFEQVLAIGIAPVKAMIEFQLARLASLMTTGGNLNDILTDFISGELMDMFPNESIADIRLCLERGAMGRYGEIQRMDGATIGRWMVKYVDEKYSEDEVRRRQSKNNEATKQPIEGLEFAYAKIRDQRKEEYNNQQLAKDELSRKFAKYATLNGTSLECRHLTLVETTAGWICNTCGNLIGDHQTERHDRPQSISKGFKRPIFICDGLEVEALDEHYARMAFKQEFKREAIKVEVKS